MCGAELNTKFLETNPLRKTLRNILRESCSQESFSLFNLLATKYFCILAKFCQGPFLIKANMKYEGFSRKIIVVTCFVPDKLYLPKADVFLWVSFSLYSEEASFHKMGSTWTSEISCSKISLLAGGKLSRILCCDSLGWKMPLLCRNIQKKVKLSWTFFAEKSLTENWRNLVRMNKRVFVRNIPQSYFWSEIDLYILSYIRALIVLRH